MTEGFNNKIKRIQRRAFGLRNEPNRKKRILVDCGKLRLGPNDGEAPAPGATDLGRFEDDARQMYKQVVPMDVPAYVIGPKLGDGPMQE
ncbi:transposase [Candidatus Entotheonella palauensis]|uniref:transposase n=1 Tax=Candidatus Entotheonella palauensis TaxID=93172 RepID=UPI000B7D0428